MKKTGLWLTFTGLICCLTAVAQQRSEVEAREIAVDFLQNVTGKLPRKQLQKAPVTGRRRVGAKTEEAAYYIFNDTEGDAFVIVSADERMKDILGYCDQNTYVSEQAPEGLKWLLDEYAAQYETIHESNFSGRRTSRQKMPHYLVTDPLPYHNVKALVATSWGQGYPYNKYCPHIGADQCITGCLATAMAQVMNYHKHPEVGTGSMSYTSLTNNISLRTSFNDPKCYDWPNMLNAYMNSFTTEQEDAVANLMKVCGISLGMDYGIDWSAADYADIPYPLHKFFGYSRNVAYIRRDFFRTDEWNEIIINELLNGRPVIYNGNTGDENGGHSFVLDGVQDKERFHINWGWYSSHNGFYALDALTPYSGVDYAFYQCAIINISPSDVGVHQDVYYADDFGVSATQIKSNEEFMATLHNVWNYSNSATSKIESTTFSGGMGIATYSTDMEMLNILGSYQVNNKMYWGWSEIYFNITLNDNNFSESDSCLIVPVIINSNNEVTPIRTLHGETDAVLAIKKNNAIVLKTLTEVETTEFEVKGLVYTWIPDRKGCVVVKGCNSVPSNGTVTVPATVSFNNDVYNVCEIGEGAFCNNEKVKVLELPNSIESIGSNALANMAALTTLKVDRSVPPHVADASAFTGITGVRLMVPADCKNIYMQDDFWKVFNNIEEEAMVIADFTYNGILYTQNPNRKNSVMIKANTPANIRGDIVIPEEVPYNDKMLTVTALGEKAFYKCEYATSLELPATIDSISRYALGSMKGLKSLKVKAVTPPKVTNQAVFSGITSVPLTVPAGSADSYKKHDYWGTFTTIKEDEDTDAIDGIMAERKQEKEIFDLSGRKLNPMVQGRQRQIIIKGGKKYTTAYGR
ncbi:MAG: C10 family peptidase [Bacteroidaceae bacterium]|nr:C10 family peptidase [Bacteroidaceae bacterium]